MKQNYVSEVKVCIHNLTYAIMRQKQMYGNKGR